jgi:hypothetical protein
MPLTSEERVQVVSELMRIGKRLNLTHAQKRTVQAFLDDARQSFADYLNNNPDATKDDIINKMKESRSEIRRRLASFLSSHQLKMWDSETAQVEQSLAQKLNSCSHASA